MRISRWRLLLAAILVTITFLFFQLLFVNRLKVLFNRNAEIGENFINPRFLVWKMKTEWSSPFREIAIVKENESSQTSNISVTVATINNSLKYFAQMKIPLDADSPDSPDSPPKLFYLLPFNHKKNMYNFETFLVQPNNSRSEVLVTLKDLNDRLFRGIDKRKFELYQPDSNGLFKCLNSNVRRFEYNIYFVLNEYCCFFFNHSNVLLFLNV